MKSPRDSLLYSESGQHLNGCVDSTDIVSAYNDNPLISKEIASRLDELRKDGDRPTRRQLLQIIYEETEKSPAIRKQREAAELAKRQQHPLFNTLFRKDLLRFWDTHGRPPPMPEKALDGFTDWIIRHADATEDEVREWSNTLEKSSQISVIDKLGELGEKYFRDYRPTPLTARNLRRTLRSAFRQCNEQVAHILGLVKKHGQEHVSNVTKKSRANQLRAQEKWIRASKVSTTVVDNRTGKEKKLTVSLGECLRTAEHRFSELYTLQHGQESYFTSQGYFPVFVTLTTPAEYHPSPSHGRSCWTGLSVKDSHDWFNERWQHMRADLAKHNIRLEGFRVAEAHKDGSEHWHIMAYVKKNQMETIKSAFSGYFGHSDHAVKFIDDFAAQGKGEKGKASASGYMLKYLVKTINRGAAAGTSAADDQNFLQETDAVDAWRSTWGIRSFQFFGTLFGKQTLWRELRRLDEQPSETAALALWRAARGGRAHHFIAYLIHLDPELATIHERTPEWTEPDPETGETEQYVKKGRIVGIKINDQFYLTHDSKWELETDYSSLNNDFDETFEPVTVIHKYPSSSPNGPNHHHPPPTATPKGVGIPAGKRDEGNKKKLRAG